ncbi:uncharacterized protein [Argopecten irradians]|uniref:uncharacterized protein n=1 Tax=Argopecten irradians TaxID=31199 RepID=UPI00371817F4
MNVYMLLMCFWHTTHSAIRYSSFKRVQNLSLSDYEDNMLAVEKNVYTTVIECSSKCQTGCLSYAYNKDTKECKTYTRAMCEGHNVNLSSVIQMYTKTSDDSACSKPNGCPSTGDCVIKDLECPMFYMDPVTLHRTRYMSRDNLTVYNGGQVSTNNYVKGTNYVTFYEGVQASRVITNTQVIYFETQIYYRIKHDLLATNVVFEIALATEDAINKKVDHVSRQEGAWSVIAYKSNTEVALFFKSDGGSERYRQTLGQITSGTEKHLTLGFFVNRVDGTISVFDIIRNTTIYTFTGVDRNEDLWPLFSGHQAFKLDVHIRLKTEMNINSLPCLCCK